MTASRPRPETMLLVSSLVIASLAASGCYAVTCGDDLMQCRARCVKAQACKPECKNTTCKESCATEYIESCRSLGVLYSSETGVVGDDRKAVELFQYACDNDDGLACTDLAFMYESGKGVTADPQTALKYYRIGCAQNVATACLGKDRLEDVAGGGAAAPSAGAGATSQSTRQ